MKTKKMMKITTMTKRSRISKRGWGYPWIPGSSSLVKTQIAAKEYQWPQTCRRLDLWLGLVAELRIAHTSYKSILIIHYSFTKESSIFVCLRLSHRSINQWKAIFTRMAISEPAAENSTSRTWAINLFIWRMMQFKNRQKTLENLKILTRWAMVIFKDTSTSFMQILISMWSNILCPRWKG